MKKSTDYAWAAGIVDGEGCIFIQRDDRLRKDSKRQVWHTLKIVIGMCHQETILKLQWILGGGLYSRPPGQVSKGPLYELHINGKKAEQALVAMLPYLVTKLDQAMIALEFRETFQKNYKTLPPEVVAQREECCQRIKDAKLLN